VPDHLGLEQTVTGYYKSATAGHFKSGQVMC
jgi:hypothetical protein